MAVVWSEAGEPVLTVEDIADRAGVTPATIHAYRSRGQMPDPDATVGRTPVWRESTVREWLSRRAGTEPHR